MNKFLKTIFWASSPVCLVAGVRFFNAYHPTLVRRTLKILQEMLQTFQSAVVYFGTLCIKS